MVLSWDSPIRHELEMVEAEMQRGVFSEQAILTEISLYVIGSGGKRIRPAVTLLSFRANGGDDSEISRIIKVASAFEMIHAATLIHDDINDAGELRRGREAAYKRYGVQKALIAGDFLFVRSFSLGGAFDERIIQIVAEAMTAIAESEILQAIHELDPDTRLKEYIKIVIGKTAKPIEAGARVGAYLAKAPLQAIEDMGAYGLNLGIAFQIIDDILDVTGNASTLGKPRGVDFMDGKPNLVLLEAMADPTIGPEVRRLFLKKEKTRADLDAALSFIATSDAVAKAKDIAKEYTAKAELALANLPESDHKRSMKQLAESLVERNT
ncbi:MAG: Short chain isoprenyl diphosphate synthase [Methanomassiliicoccales archaeon PtaU1.Bin124]|nr:MAG: Short chain isoprenyl diphosphate synthase [Methanomassiliicoccales archaeon PtaU1.Bin124]